MPVLCVSPYGICGTAVLTSSGVRGLTSGMLLPGGSEARGGGGARVHCLSRRVYRYTHISHPAIPYAIAMPCPLLASVMMLRTPVLASGMLLRPRYGVCGTDAEILLYQVAADVLRRPT
eukprot:102967-Rhodomonas_salina.2